MFCFCRFTLSLASGFFQRTSPLVLSRHQSERLLPSATFKKIRSRQMIGVEPLQPGIAVFQATFSSVVHLTGRFFSLLTPFSDGPRHCGQFCAWATTAVTKKTARSATNPLRILFLLCAFLWLTLLAAPVATANAKRRVWRPAMPLRPKAKQPAVTDPARCLEAGPHARRAPAQSQKGRRQIPLPDRSKASARFP